MRETWTSKGKNMSTENESLGQIKSGWRLLEVGEVRQPDDEYYSPSRWNKCLDFSPVAKETVPIRRRINLPAGDGKDWRAMSVTEICADNQNVMAYVSQLERANDAQNKAVSDAFEQQKLDCGTLTKLVQEREAIRKERDELSARLKHEDAVYCECRKQLSAANKRVEELQEHLDCMIRTNAGHMDQVQIQFDKIKEQAKEIAQLKSQSTEPEASPWLPIDTAPMDGQRVIGYTDDWRAVFPIKYSPNRPAPHWTTDDGAVHNPTHWTPLPPLPKPEEDVRFKKWFTKEYLGVVDSTDYAIAKASWNAAIASQTDSSPSK